MTHVVYALAEGMDVRYAGYTARPNQRRLEHGRRRPGLHWLVLGVYPTREDGLEHEIWWISRLHLAGHPLENVDPGGKASKPGTEKSYLTRAKLSASLRGHGLSSEARAKIGLANRNRHATAETRAKMSASHMGHPTSQATRDRIGASVAASWPRRKASANG